VDDPFDTAAGEAPDLPAADAPAGAAPAAPRRRAGAPRGRVIDLVDARSLRRPLPAAPALPADGPPAVFAPDRLGRPLHDLRISVTDQCNFRCVYCMPKEIFSGDHSYIAREERLSFDEIARVARLFVARGVRKIRLTGGEPLLRKDIERLVETLAGLRMPDGGAPDLALTTNGSLLARKAPGLAAAGLRRLTVSLDAIDEAVFRRISDVATPVRQVLDGIEAAADAGLGPLKINMVVRRGYNEDQILPMARHFRARGHVLRFIEFMDVGTSNAWRPGEVVATRDVLAQLAGPLPFEPVLEDSPSGVAERWRYRDGGGEFGTISSVSRPFCGDCSRARLSADGQLFLCLFARQGHDLRALLRSGADDRQIGAALGALWSKRQDRYSELRGAAPRAAQDGRRIEMSYIGG
jgi:cyclic pyranopterin phosphate synthase